jgi:AmmeMemoRadiSam system protein B
MSRSLGPAVAGTWYPSDPRVLARQVDGLLDGAAEVPGPGPRGRVVALIEPHAGYTYSGAVAARGFRAVRRLTPSRVVLIGPSHYEAFLGAAVPDAEAYRTPLGDTALDVEALATLGRRSGFKTRNRPFGPEHSLEAEIPFLQRTLSPGWRLVPVLIGAGTTGAAAAEIADGIRGVVDASTLLVVSSDFTHYGPRFGYVPFTTQVPDRIRDLDMGAIRAVESRDVASFENYVDRTGATICGRDAISILMHLLPEDVASEVTAYDTSGRQTGDWENSVSYAALTFRAAATEA